jgi:hypothetical protein
MHQRAYSRTEMQTLVAWSSRTAYNGKWAKSDQVLYLLGYPKES